MKNFAQFCRDMVQQGTFADLRIDETFRSIERGPKGIERLLPLTQKEALEIWLRYGTPPPFEGTALLLQAWTDIKDAATAEAVKDWFVKDRQKAGERMGPMDIALSGETVAGYLQALFVLEEDASSKSRTVSFQQFALFFRVLLRMNGRDGLPVTKVRSFCFVVLLETVPTLFRFMSFPRIRSTMAARKRICAIIEAECTVTSTWTAEQLISSPPKNLSGISRYCRP